MKRILFIMLLPALAIPAIITTGWTNAVERNTVVNDGFAVVELFTSEGCSSCPAADAALSRIAANYKNNVYVLGFHVDYWNRLGWKDVFSDALFSERQRKYSETIHGDGVYTPQVIINGNQHFVGSSESRIRGAIDEYISAPNASSIALSAKESEGHHLSVDYSFDNKNDVLNIALVQLHSETKVKGGENSGRTLQHINIVRDFKTLYDSKGMVQLKLPPSLSAKDCSVIAYLQNKNSWVVTGAKDFRFN